MRRAPGSRVLCSLALVTLLAGCTPTIIDYGPSPTGAASGFPCPPFERAASALPAPEVRSGRVRIGKVSYPTAPAPYSAASTAIEAPASNSVIGRTTESQMLIGVYWGYVSMMEGLIARMKAEIGKPLTVIATGGLATLFQEQAHLFDRIEPDLTLNGLMHLYHQRKPTS